VRIQEDEYRRRTAALADHARERGLEGVVLFDPTYVLYYAGFAFVPTERPMAFALNIDGEGGMLVPRLEREHAKANALVQHVADYPEYPSETIPPSRCARCSASWACASSSAPTRTATHGSSVTAAPR
jgi:Xaa-Pro dipeptidase